MAVDRVKMIFQTPNKGSTCFKHHKFLNFDEKKYPQNFYTTDFKISLVQWNLDLRKPDLRKNLDLRKIVGTNDFLVHKLFDLRKIF